MSSIGNPFEIIERKLHNIECMLVDGKFQQVKTEIPPVEIVTGEVLCKRFDVTIQTLIRWRQKGKIPFIQIGSAIRYDFNKVVAALEVSNKKKN